MRLQCVSDGSMAAHIERQPVRLQNIPGIFIEPKRTRNIGVYQFEYWHLVKYFVHGETTTKSTKPTRFTKKQNIYFYFLFTVVTTYTFYLHICLHNKIFNLFENTAHIYYILIFDPVLYFIKVCLRHTKLDVWMDTMIVAQTYYF